MAEPPLAVFRLDVAPAAMIVLLYVYRRCVRQDVLDLYQCGQGPAPFVWIKWGKIHRETGYSRSAIYLAWDQLEAVGALRIATGMNKEGKIVKGWNVLVLDPLVSGQPEDLPVQASQAVHGDGQHQPAVHGDGQQARPAVHGDGQQSREKSSKPLDSDRPSPDTPSKPLDSDRPSPWKKPSKPLDENSSSSNLTIKNHDAAEESSEMRRAREAASASADRPAISGHGPEALIAAIAALYTPTLPTGEIDRTRAFMSSDRRLLDRARRLLAVPPQPSPEATQAALKERWEHVLTTLTVYARLCARNPDKAQYWRPGMLETEPAPGKTKSAWAMIERDASDAVRAEAEQQLRQRELDAASRPRDPRPATTRLSPEEEAARAATVERGEAFAQSLGSKPADGRRGAAARRAAAEEAEREEDDELERRLAMNRELAAAQIEEQRRHGENATISPQQHAEIRRKHGF